MRRSAEGELNWTIAAHPTPAAAQDAGMSLRDYADVNGHLPASFAPLVDEVYGDLLARVARG